jgi:hypothetical protein
MAGGRCTATTSRLRLALLLFLLLPAALMMGCEAIGAPDAYRTQVCAAVADLAGPLPAAVKAVDAAASEHDRTAILAAAEALTVVVERIAGRLVDVPLWVPGIDVVADIRSLVDAYRAAIAELRQAVPNGDQAGIDSAMAGLQAARLTAPGLGDHLRTARLSGLNC